MRSILGVEDKERNDEERGPGEQKHRRRAEGAAQQEDDDAGSDVKGREEFLRGVNFGAVVEVASHQNGQENHSCNHQATLGREHDIVVVKHGGGAGAEDEEPHEEADEGVKAGAGRCEVV
ncbi:hypothetical protein HPP92_008954 [Vanilla planifolia]|uniref:Uncharacterized protein n=1 Tax=Vanilla planifolia TaxID=51239 RepID=A0A835RBF8_VANPL|nr:hypothetical protein HPP92_008954 [Vanilla planifolia]